MVTPSLLEELNRESEAQALADIRFLQGSVAETARIREMFPDDWEIQELCRSIIFDANQNIQAFMKEVERVREARKELSRIPG